MTSPSDNKSGDLLGLDSLPENQDQRIFPSLQSHSYF